MSLPDTEANGSAPAAHPAARWYAAAGAVIAGGALLRCWAAQGDLWLDEIWSYALSRSVQSPLGVFTQIHHDNNHHLVTLWMYWLGYQEQLLAFRLPSLLAGVGTMALAAVFARRWGTLPMFLAALLTAGSYVLVIYSSEARGYALLGLFALASFLALERFLEFHRWRWLFLFWAFVVLGFTSHLTFAHCYFGACLWSLVHRWHVARSWRAVWRTMAVCHAVPCVFLAVFYTISLRNMEIGGGDAVDIGEVVIKTLSLTVGGPLDPSADQYVIALLAGAAGVAAIAFLWAEGSDLWVFFALTIYISPLFLLIEQPRSGLFVRYFYLNVLFLLLLLSYFLGCLRRVDNLGTVATVIIMAVILAGNFWRLKEFSTDRRGQYLAAMRFMREHSTGPDREIDVDHMRTFLTMRFYEPYLGPDYVLNLAPPTAVPSTAAQWYVVHKERAGLQQAPEIIDAAGDPLVLAGVFRHAGLSGFDWAIYYRPPHAPQDSPR